MITTSTMTTTTIRFDCFESFILLLLHTYTRRVETGRAFESFVSLSNFLKVYCDYSLALTLSIPSIYHVLSQSSPVQSSRSVNVNMVMTDRSK